MDNKGVIISLTINGAFVMLLFMPAISLYPLMTLDYFWWFRWTGGQWSSLRSRNALRRCTDQFYRNMERPNETYY